MSYGERFSTLMSMSAASHEPVSTSRVDFDWKRFETELLGSPVPMRRAKPAGRRLMSSTRIANWLKKGERLRSETFTMQQADKIGQPEITQRNDTPRLLAEAYRDRLENIADGVVSETKEIAELDHLATLMDVYNAAHMREMSDPTPENHARRMKASQAVKDFQAFRAIPDFWPVPVVEPQTPSSAEILAEKLERLSLEKLADVGITPTPTKPLPRPEDFGGIFCVVCDRDQFDFIGTNRQESWLELALTYDAAFHRMVWMSGFSEDVLEEKEIDFSAPDLDALVKVLNDLTHDTWSYMPYETAIERRLLAFLQ